MRRSVLKFGAIVIVAICVGGHISELFDRWENAVISGDDVDYTCVVVAAVAGAVLMSSGMLGKFFAARPKPLPVPLTDHQFVVSPAPESVIAAHSPPLAIRI